MKKITCLLLAFLFVFIGLSSDINASPSNYATIKSACDATVLEVIDGDSFVARINATGEYALVRMVGVDSQGYTPAYEYTTARLLGSTVFLIPDSGVKSPADRWNYVYVSLGANSFNHTLIAGGYAKVRDSDSGASQYQIYKNSEIIARSQNLGIWNLTTSTTPYVYATGMVNLNTASQTQIRDALKLKDAMAEAIVKSRLNHPYRTIYEVKFATSMDKETFDLIRAKITVCTNINKASKQDLQMLSGITADEADAIVTYRDQYGFSNLSTLYDQRLISVTKYNQNKPYISLTDTDVIHYAIPDSVVNINTASEDQLKNIGFDSGQYNKTINARKTYSFKNMREIAVLLNFSTTTEWYYDDNLNMLTNVNIAGKAELTSLFGPNANATKNAEAIMMERPFASLYALQRILDADMYERCKNYVTMGPADNSVYVNLNAAAYEQLTALGMNGTQANQVLAKRLSMKTPADLPFDMKAAGFDMKVTLYTNINKASAFELKTLSPYMTDEAANAIMAYRNDQPFGSLEEFYTYLYSLGKGMIYDTVKDYLTVR